MKYDYFAFLKRERFSSLTYNKFIQEQNLYFLHGKRDKIFGNKPGDNRAVFFKHKDNVYNLCPDSFWDTQIYTNGTHIKIFGFKFTLSSNFYTASENEFYSIANPIAKEKVTGLPIYKGSSLKGALRHAAVDVLEDEMMDQYFGEYTDLSEDEILERETEGKDRFFFKERSQLVKIFGNERDATWFTFKTLLATGGIRDVSKIKDILSKITTAFTNYLKKHKIVNSEGVCRGRLIFEDLYFKKVSLDVITPLDRKKRTPTRGPHYYEVVPKTETTEGKIVWFPFDLIAEGEFDEIESEWEKDRKIIKKAFDKLQKKGIGAKTKDGWGNFKWEEL